MEGLSEALRYELRQFNIQVKIIEPGGTRTNFINRGTTWSSHPKYTELIDRVKQFSESLNHSLPGPGGVAKAIYKAANDRSERLRYSPYGEAFLRVHAVLPDFLWRSLVTRMMFGSK